MYYERKTVLWFPIRPDTNRAVQAENIARSLIFLFSIMRDCTIRVAKTKALISFAVTVKLKAHLSFMQIL